MDANPNYLLRGVFAVGAAVVSVIALLVVLSVIHSASSCIVNGLGNKLCGGDARAYCELLDSQGVMDPWGLDETTRACESVGWKFG